MSLCSTRVGGSLAVQGLLDSLVGVHAAACGGSIRKSGVPRMIGRQKLGHSSFFSLPGREHPRLPDAPVSKPSTASLA